MIRRVFHVWFRNGFYFDLLSHRGHWRRVWPLPFIVRKSYAPVCIFFYGVFQKLFILFHVTTFWRRAVTILCFYSVISNLYCTLLRLLAMRPSAGYFPVFEPAICHHHLAVMATHLWNAFLWIPRAVSIFSARDALKGECLNPSAHDQTCFSRLVQKRILFRSFVTPWALTKSVTTAFHCSEELCSRLYFLLRRFSKTFYSISCYYILTPSSYHLMFLFSYFLPRKSQINSDYKRWV